MDMSYHIMRVHCNVMNNISHYLSERVCSNPDHVNSDNLTLRYKTDNKCVLCRKEQRTIYKNCCPIPSLPQQLRNYLDIGNFPDDCIDWWGSFYSNGYGHIREGKKDLLAHRYALSYYLGVELDLDTHVCHRCDRVSCINPKHLFVGPKARVKTWIAEEMRMKYIPRKYTIPMLAEEYKVSESLVSKIVQNRLWVNS
jgi:hypothetical protein